jgi:hypothetical protein
VPPWFAHWQGHMSARQGRSQWRPSHSRSFKVAGDRGQEREKNPQLAGSWGFSALGVMSAYLLSVVRKFAHAAWPNGSSGLSAVLESRTRTLPPSWPTSTHAPPLPPLRLDLRHCGSRVSIVRSPLFESVRGMPPWGVLPIVPARSCQESWRSSSQRR